MSADLEKIAARLSRQLGRVVATDVDAILDGVDRLAADRHASANRATVAEQAARTSRESLRLVAEELGATDATPAQLVRLVHHLVRVAEMAAPVRRAIVGLTDDVPPVEVPRIAADVRRRLTELEVLLGGADGDWTDTIHNLRELLDGRPVREAATAARQLRRWHADWEAALAEAGLPAETGRRVALASIIVRMAHEMGPIPTETP